MGSNISQHSAKGLKGRRARSSGDLCNGDSKSQTESSVCGSVVGDMAWNRSLPNHLDGNRHLAEYSRVNNNYAEFSTYNRCHPKGGRGLRYRVSKSGKFIVFSLFQYCCPFCSFSKITYLINVEFWGFLYVALFVGYRARIINGYL